MIPPAAPPQLPAPRVEPERTGGQPRPPRSGILRTVAGHSRWAQIKRKKGAEDQKRGQLFTKLAREVTVAAREGGGDPDANFTLRLAMERARAANMPKENIERAIKRGTGELKGEAAFEEVIYEGYGPEGAALVVSCLTDNRNRTVSEVRRTFSRHGGSLAEAGAVTWMFQPRGLIVVHAHGEGAEELALLAIDEGAEDVRVDGDLVEIYTAVSDLQEVKETLEKRSVEMESAEIALVPRTALTLDTEAALRNLRLMEALEELEDVRRVFTNLEITHEALARFETG